MRVEDVGLGAMISEQEGKSLWGLLAATAAIAGATIASAKKIWNPYLRELEDKKLFEEGEVYKDYDFGTYRDHREGMTEKYAWAIPSDEVIEEMVEFAPKYLEMGAGSGYWARALNEAGAEVEAYDDGSWEYPPTWYDVKKGGVEKIPDHVDPESSLLLVWRSPEAPVTLSRHFESSIMFRLVAALLTMVFGSRSAVRPPCSWQ
mgnify:CR=1 FL=1